MATTAITLSKSAASYRLSGATWEYTVSRATGLIEGAAARGEAWLAAPVPDLWASGAVDPRADAYHARYTPSAEVRLVSAGPDPAVIEAEGSFARVDGASLPLAWQLRYTFDGDGTVRVDVTLRARAALALRWLSLGRGEVNPTVCHFLAHEADLADGPGTCRPACHDLAAGAYEAGGRFVPWVQFGSDRGGLEVLFPHSAGAAWGWTDTCPYPTGDPLGPAGQRMVIRAGSGHPSWETFLIRNLYELLHEGWSLSDTFYLSLLPGKKVRPEADDLRVWWIGPHQYRSGWRPPGEESIAEWAAAGANTVIGGANWRSGDYSHPDGPEESAAFIETCHRYGLRVLPYLTFTDLEFGAPAFEEHGREWRIEPVSEFNYRTHLMCYGAEGWQEHWEREVAGAWEMLPFDGLYIDFWAGRLACRNERHGCTGPFGRFTAAGLRRMARFAHRLADQRGGLIVANCNILPLAMLNSTFDVRLLGEWNNLEETEPLPVRIFHNAHRYGCGNLLLVSKIPQITERTLAVTAAFQGQPVLSQARTEAERELLSRRARLLASFDTARAVARNAFETPAPAEGVRLSLFRREDNGEMLVTLSRLEPEPVPVPLTFLDGIAGPAEGRRLAVCFEEGTLLGGRALNPCDLEDVAVEVPGNAVRTLWIRPDPEAPSLLCALSGRPRPHAEWNAGERLLSFTVEHPSLSAAEVLLIGPAPEAFTAGDAPVVFDAGCGCVRAAVPCNVPVTVRFPPPRLPQLRMRFTRFDDLPDLPLPEGYEIRAYRAGDEAAWAEVLNSAGDLGRWDVCRVIRLLNSDRHAVPEGSFLATWQGLPVGAACTVIGPGQEDPEVGWVSVMPEHRGHRLAAHLCLAVLRFMAARGIRECFLLTDDFRVPAIRTYLRLGFEPQVTDPSHPGRWRKLLGETAGP